MRYRIEVKCQQAIHMHKFRKIGTKCIAYPISIRRALLFLLRMLNALRIAILRLADLLQKFNFNKYKWKRTWTCD